MKVKFHLPNGKVSDLITVTIPLFFAKTPQAFVDIAGFFQSAKEGFLNLKELAKILWKYPESKASLQMLKEMRSPASFSALSSARLDGAQAGRAFHQVELERLLCVGREARTHVRINQSERQYFPLGWACACS